MSSQIDEVELDIQSGGFEVLPYIVEKRDCRERGNSFVLSDLTFRKNAMERKDKTDLIRFYFQVFESIFTHVSRIERDRPRVDYKTALETARRRGRAAGEKLENV